jgi:hypothetical protein
VESYLLPELDPEDTARWYFLTLILEKEHLEYIYAILGSDSFANDLGLKYCMILRASCSDFSHLAVCSCAKTIRVLCDQIEFRDVLWKVMNDIISRTEDPNVFACVFNAFSLIKLSQFLASVLKCSIAF